MDVAAMVNARGEKAMHNFAAEVERDQKTGLYVGFVPGFPGAHAQAESLDELSGNLREVIEMLLAASDPIRESP